LLTTDQFVLTDANMSKKMSIQLKKHSSKQLTVNQTKLSIETVNANHAKNLTSAAQSAQMLLLTQMTQISHIFTMTAHSTNALSVRPMFKFYGKMERHMWLISINTLLTMPMNGGSKAVDILIVDQ